jgi:hypothetical protein
MSSPWRSTCPLQGSRRYHNEHPSPQAGASSTAWHGKRVGVMLNSPSRQVVTSPPLSGRIVAALVRCCQCCCQIVAKHAAYRGDLSLGGSGATPFLWKGTYGCRIVHQDEVGTKKTVCQKFCKDRAATKTWRTVPRAAFRQRPGPFPAEAKSSPLHTGNQ